MAKATNKKAAVPKKAAAQKVAAKKVAAKSAPKKAAAKKVAAKSAPLKVAAKKVAVPKKAAAASDETMLQELFLDSIKDMYWAEKSLTKVLPKMSKAATSPELQQAFTQHLQVTEGQVGRLEQVFELLGKKAAGVKCDAMVGLTKEAETMIQDTKKGSKTRDVALIMAAQKVEHYEIASYGSMATLAAQMGLSEAKELLGQTLQEEKDTDSLLTQIAESSINQQAEQEGSEEEEGGQESGGDEEKLTKDAEVEEEE
ncbi:MAG: ferritin-like domain-containing protein [Segetibacter sp.]|nr:ferritin-like domain-containing protein [Segetibacter sp.]